MPLPLVQSHQDYLQAIVGLGLHIQSLIPESESLEEALRKLEEPDSFFHIPLLVSRKCCARGLLMSAGLPQSFPLMFSDLMISSTKSLQAILKGHVEGLVKQQKQAYEGSLVKDLEKQLLAAIGKIGLAEIQEFLDSLLNWFHDSLAFGVSGNETLLLNADRKEDIMTITGVRGLARIRNMIETVVRGMELLRRNVQPTLVLESVLMNIGGSNP